MRDQVRPDAVRPDALLPDAPDPSSAQLVQVAEVLAARADLWDALADRLAPDEPARVAGGRGWEAWLEAADGDVVRLEVRTRRSGRRPRAVARWRRTRAGLTPLDHVDLAVDLEERAS
ncbi:hypothetical protein [Kineosporia sp. R_H_3]|uniref:hypothetical protein n=1 Tax=Kineosporia sp. R_H_3 TaxID=1961848 RepID=UPI000B4C0D02|nr:hypothetical protein [Kineosporia sp. R_H_3]